MINRAAQGFTLIELLITITIGSILAGLTIPGLYGSYQHQQMLNTANEIVTAISQARSRALANYQGQYSVPKPVGPLSTCDTTHPYVDAYVFSIKPGKDGYTVKQSFRNGTNNSCAVPSPLPTPMVDVSLPNSIVINEVSPAVSFPLSYKTTSGEFNIANGQSAYIDLVSNGGPLGNAQHYYVCISANQLYAQQDHC
jgi:prepilin-type N-terminal cleavage/methylation domain-containing protein